MLTPNSAAMPAQRQRRARRHLAVHDPRPERAVDPLVGRQARSRSGARARSSPRLRRPAAPRQAARPKSQACSAAPFRRSQSRGASIVRAEPPHHRPEARRVVQLGEMRHLVRHHVVEHRRRRHDQPPGEHQVAARGARPPARARIAQADPARLHARAPPRAASTAATQARRASSRSQAATRGREPRRPARAPAARRRRRPIRPPGRGADRQRARRRTAAPCRRRPAAPGGPRRQVPPQPALLVAEERPRLGDRHARRQRQRRPAPACATRSTMRRARALRRSRTSIAGSPMRMASATGAASDRRGAARG